MKRIVFLIMAIGLGCCAGGTADACSSFMLERGDTVLVGHNLDEYLPVPGLVVVNPRGIAKHGLGGSMLNPLGTVKPRFAWVSKYGSVTYNPMGKEFPDGGINEAGLYVGEMNYYFTEWPKGDGPVRIYHNQWIQYQLDNFETVDQVLAGLARVVPDGHNRWQFFVADSTGAAATITFVKGRAVVNAGDSLPVKALCNRRYARELDTLRLYQGFGGTRAVDFADTMDDRRFVRAAEMLRAQDRKVAAADYAVAILRRLDWGNNKWSLAFDLKRRTVRFDTDRSRTTKTLDLAAFDFSPGAPAMVLDINRDLEGDVTKLFTPYSESVQREYVAKMWDGIDTGFLGNLMFKPLMKSRMVSSIRGFQPAR
ncbi:MAG: linear amide C-N hydrolase [Candidatus Edwardsbacteria bacterium]|jgi:choloylglycine hydrolase|nr:linear amide C-N hydrolase [Candidatus Edwardsbacteria bacterium]